MLAHAESTFNSDFVRSPHRNSCSTLRDSVSPLTRSSSSVPVLVVSSIADSTRGQTSIDRSFRHELPRSSQRACAHLEVANCQLKSLKLVKERLCFYSCRHRSQLNIRNCIYLYFQSSAARPQAHARFLCKQEIDLSEGDISSRIHAASIRSRSDSLRRVRVIPFVGI